MTYTIQPPSMKLLSIEKNIDGLLEIEIDIFEAGTIPSFSIEASSASGLQGSSSDFSIKVIPNCLYDTIWLNQTIPNKKEPHSSLFEKEGTIKFASSTAIIEELAFSKPVFETSFGETVYT